MRKDGNSGRIVADLEGQKIADRAQDAAVFCWDLRRWGRLSRLRCFWVVLVGLCIQSSMVCLTGCSGISRPVLPDGSVRIREGQFLKFPGKTLYVHRRNGQRLYNVTVYEWDRGRMARRYHCDLATLVSESADGGVIIHMPKGVSYEAVPGDVRMRGFDSRTIVVLAPGKISPGGDPVRPAREGRPE